MNKQNQALRVAALSGLFLFVFSMSVYAAEKVKIAVVDIGKVFDDYEKTKKFDQEFQNVGKEKQKDRDALVQEIRKLRDELALLTDNAKPAKQEAIEKKMKELDGFDEESKKQLADKRNAAVKDVFDDIEGVLKQYGERKGYDFILNDRAVLYAPQSYNVTAEVLAEINQKYIKEKK